MVGREGMVVMGGRGVDIVERERGKEGELEMG